jgi:hypothetical protein
MSPLLVVLLVLAALAVLAAAGVALRRVRGRGRAFVPLAGAADAPDGGRIDTLEARIGALEATLERHLAETASAGRTEDESGVGRADLDALAASLRAEWTEALARRAEAEPGTPLPPEARVLRALRAEGFGDPRLLGPADRPGAWRVEGQRAGAVQKGIAVVDADGEVSLTLESGLRAFP